MSEAIDAAIADLTRLGGEAAHEGHAGFSRNLLFLLDAEPQSIRDMAAYHAALQHGFAYYYWRWDRRGLALYDSLAAAIWRWARAPSPRLGLLCDLVDFTFFLVWCFEESSARQCERLILPLQTAARSFARSRPPPDLPRPVLKRGYRVAWLAMYAQSDNPMSAALRTVAPTLRSLGHQLDVYTWRFRDDAFREDVTSAGAGWQELDASTPEATILAVEAQAVLDRPDIVVSDMNNAVPTALFARQLAPTQIFLQAGMPAWPVRPLDGVFNSFGFDSKKAGWGNAAMLRFDSPWDADALNPPVAEADIAAERALLPPDTRLVGSYGRFSKVSLAYLQAVEQILLSCPDVTLVLGGTGDASHVKSFIASSPAGARMWVTERYVQSHIWGHILELLLDTWPVTGGFSAREMLAKSKPVVTHHSAEMPAIHRQRDPALVAESWESFTEIAVTLLQDREAYAAACRRAGELVRRLSDIGSFEQQLDDGFHRAVGHARSRRAPLGRIMSALRGILRLEEI